MNISLQKTHVRKNVDIMKTRDYYFNISKTLNLVKSIIVSTPPILLMLSYLLEFKINSFFSREYFDLFIGTLTVFSMITTYIIDNYISKYCGISNALRAYYDHKVLGTKYNSLIYQVDKIENYIKKSKKVNYNSKYEVWYSEVFSDNHYANVFCCQIDNLLYSKHAYSKAKSFYLVLLSAFSTLVIGAIIFSIISNNIISAFLIIFSVVECYDVFYGKINTIKEALCVCTAFCDFAENLSLEDLDENIIEKTQEIVSQNRNLCIFLPRIIRNQFLEDDNPFYRELNKYKNKYMGDQAAIPEKSECIDIMFEDGSDAIALSYVQSRLNDMLKAVTSVLDNAGIEYTLDGGTLIGAMRPTSHGFLPWDDDIDIALSINQIKKAKKVLQDNLNYVVQDAENESFYSPRLAMFRIREPNNLSIIAEKDSLFYDKYKNRGLFIDVYAFSPILISRAVDTIFRKLIIHPLNRKIEKVENDCTKKMSEKKRIKQFFRLKNRYLSILSFYQKNAKNTAFYAYFPGYIHDYSKAGPYLPSEVLYGENTTYAMWEGKKQKVPADSNSVLCACYGDDWISPPFCGKKELVDNYGEGWFSKAPCKISALKHISNFVSYKR